jgi:hypothetical protein
MMSISTKNFVRCSHNTCNNRHFGSI